MHGVHKQELHLMRSSGCSDTLFRGREDVFAAAGNSDENREKRLLPVCANEWLPVSAGSRRFPSAKCPSRELVR
jgi:hypothetical protein